MCIDWFQLPPLKRRFPEHCGRCCRVFWEKKKIRLWIFHLKSVCWSSCSSGIAPLSGEKGRWQLLSEKKKKKQKTTNIQAKRSSAAIQDRNFEAHVIIQVIKKHGTYISQEIMCSWRSWKRENAVGWGSYQWGYRAFRALGPSSGTAWDSRCARHNIPWAELRDSNPLLHRHGQKTGPLPHRTHMEITWTKDLTDQECDHLKTIFSNHSKGRVIHPQSRESLLPTEPSGFNPTVRSFLRRLN